MKKIEKEKQWLNKMYESDDTASPFSSYLLRHVLLPEILGEEEETILYWAGKSLARKLYDETSGADLELATFFEKANWGQLTLLKEKKKELVYELVAPHMVKERPFTLECGFLAQWVEMANGYITEAAYDVRKNDPCTIRITVRWDLSDPI